MCAQLRERPLGSQRHDARDERREAGSSGIAGGILGCGSVRPVGVGGLLAAALELYRRNARLVLAVTVPIVVVVTGLTALGLGELGAHFKPQLPLRDTYIQLAANQLVTVPLISAILARWVLLTRRGERTNATDLVANALEVFPAVLLVIVAWLAAVFVGLFLIVPGVYILISWYFVVQAVVIDGDRGLAPIAAQRGAGAWALVAERARGRRLPARRVRASGADRARVHGTRPRRQRLRGGGPRRGRRQRCHAPVPRDRRDALLPPAARGRRDTGKGVTVAPRPAGSDRVAR